MFEVLDAPLQQSLATSAVVTAAMLFALWLLSLRLRNAAIIDSYWGPGFLVISTVAAALTPTLGPRAILLLVLVALWSLRLGVFLTWRNHGLGEDYRYRAMREYHGASFGRVSLVTVFGFQALLMWIISTPLQATITGSAQDPLSLLDGLGVALWAIGFFFEVVGDWQLARFKADPGNAGHVMDRGLWAYTRHPNYFGETMIWWSYAVFALASSAGPWTLFGPALMTFLLLKVSGVALLERGMEDRRPGYAAYVAQTSAFFPWPRRADSATREDS
jgi:steroid 5-alpha reductase family enzyme